MTFFEILTVGPFFMFVSASILYAVERVVGPLKGAPGLGVFSFSMLATVLLIWVVTQDYAPSGDWWEGDELVDFTCDEKTAQSVVR